MHKAQRWRYYCDYCKKSGCSGGHMRKHEERCTLNPNRTCGCCTMAGLIQQPIADLMAAFLHEDGDGVERLRTIADGCPACMLAAIRQTPPEKRFTADAEGFDVFPDFNFREEMARFMDRVNDARATEEDYSNYHPW